MSGRSKQKRRTRWTESEAREELRRYERSGLSLSAYARKRGVSIQRLSWWRKRLGKQEAAPESLTLVPAVVTSAPTGPSVRIYAPTESSEVVVEVCADPSPQWVADLVVHLGARSC